MGTKMAVAFANIFMAKIETQILSKSTYRPFRFQALHRRYFLPLGQKQRRRTAVHCTMEQSPSNYQVYG